MKYQQNWGISFEINGMDFVSSILNEHHLWPSARIIFKIIPYGIFLYNSLLKFDNLQVQMRSHISNSEFSIINLQKMSEFIKTLGILGILFKFASSYQSCPYYSAYEKKKKKTF